MRIVLLGAPGSGKGTQSQKLIEQYQVPQISTGDLLRAAVTNGTELGNKAKGYMDAGQLVPDEVVLGMIEERLAQADTHNGFILDGFPRNIPQAEALDTLLARIEQPLQAAILIDVAFEVLLQRITGRRSCGNCGAVYNIYTTPPAQEDVCDKCGGELTHRSDDNEDTIGKRLHTYEDQTAPLTSYYDGQHKLHKVDGLGEIDEIFAALKNIINSAM